MKYKYTVLRILKGKKSVTNTALLEKVYACGRNMKVLRILNYKKRNTSTELKKNSVTSTDYYYG